MLAGGGNEFRFDKALAELANHLITLLHRSLPIPPAGAFFGAYINSKKRSSQTSQPHTKSQRGSDDYDSRKTLSKSNLLYLYGHSSIGSECTENGSRSCDGDKPH
jgi:hypothetical protein